MLLGTCSNGGTSTTGLESRPHPIQISERNQEGVADAGVEVMEGQGVCATKITARRWKIHKKTVDDANYDLPLPAPVLQDTSRQTSESFFVNVSDLDTRREIKLTVEFLTLVQHDQSNDVALYFGEFATVLLSAHTSIAILNWENPLQKPVTKAVDIAPDENTVCQYFAGMVVQANRKK